MGHSYTASPMMLPGVLLSALDSNRKYPNNSSEGPSPRPKVVRGSTSCVVGVEQEYPAHNTPAHFDPLAAGTSRSNVHIKRGRTSGVQCLSGNAGYFFGAGHQLALTEEPISITDTPFNALQARACNQPMPAATEALKAQNPRQPIAGDKVMIEGTKTSDDTGIKEPTPKANKEVQVCQTETCPKPLLASAYNAPFPRKPLPWRVGTDPAPVSPTTLRTAVRTTTRPHPFRTTTAHHPSDILPHRTLESPLQTSLYNGSRNTPTLFMLVIAVAYNDLEDPQHDFELIQSWLKNHESGRIRFQGISGEEATRERIEEAIGELYREALQSHGSKLLILLTGEGDHTNRMHLMGERFITDSDLRIWLWKLRNEGKPIYIPTTIVLDYCRVNKHIPLGAMQTGVEFIWSCSLGQRAAALKFKSSEGMPRSCFLIALIMASYNFPHTKSNFSAMIDRRLDQLLRFLELVKKLRDDYHEEPQKADWQQAGHMQPVHDLASMLSGMDVVPKVYKALMNNKWFREANGL